MAVEQGLPVVQHYSVSGHLGPKGSVGSLTAEYIGLLGVRNRKAFLTFC